METLLIKDAPGLMIDIAKEKINEFEETAMEAKMKHTGILTMSRT